MLSAVLIILRYNSSPGGSMQRYLALLVIASIAVSGCTSTGSASGKRPMTNMEKGAIIGAAEDPRYPPVRAEDLTTLTLEAYHTLLDRAPAYFFAHTPWLLANSAGEHLDERFEQAAWYKDREGATLPVVEALKADPRKNEIRNWQEPELPASD